MSFISNTGDFLAKSRKSVAAAVGVALTVLAVVAQPTITQILPPSVATGVAVAIAVLTPVAVWLTPNKPWDGAGTSPG